MNEFAIYKRVLPSVGPIIFRNVFLMVNAVIIVVVALLINFGSTQAGLFIGIVFLLNTSFSIAQDIHARVILERLQMLTALRVFRINKNKTETSIMAEEIKKGDLLKLELGNQIPCDGVLISAESMEISEALITGESDSFPKKVGDKIIAGAIITSGFCIMEAQGLFIESRLAKLAGDVKKYAANPSSIQQATNSIIKYFGYILIICLLFVVIRGYFVHAPTIEMVSNAGALASALVPQGLMVVVTLLFAIGAASYSKRNVLFQEINATEKLGRIKNICIDKTGTLTGNILKVKEMYVFKDFSKDEVLAFSHACVLGFGDSSQTIVAVRKYVEKNIKKTSKVKEILSVFPFTSWRRYGAVSMKEGNKTDILIIGAPDVFLPRIFNSEEKEWLGKIVKENTRAGRRVLCIARAKGSELPKDLSKSHLSVMAIFVFHNTLREGIIDAISFFKKRGVKIRVLSGDNAETVMAVASNVGIDCMNEVVTGEQMEKWKDEDFEKFAYQHTIFAQILPEHKVKLIEAFKKDGFTAMVGDGVNDALALKKSDLGIAMFDGAPVTRQLAGVILKTNSFSDLPGAIELADHFIRSLEITAGIYLNQSFTSLFFFIIISFFGYSFPFTPLNITFINYLTIAMSQVLISYWALRPTGKALSSNKKPFFTRIMPLVVFCSIAEAIGAALVLIFVSKALVLFVFILFGFAFLIIAASVYGGSLTHKEKIQLLFLGIAEAILLYFALQIPFVVSFFNITLP